MPGAESKTLAKSSIFGDLKAVLIFSFQILLLFLDQLKPMPPTSAEFFKLTFPKGKSK